MKYLYNHFNAAAICLRTSATSFNFNTRTNHRPRKNESSEMEWELEPDYMSRAASLCRDDFEPGITWGEPAQLMADAKKRFWREEGASRSIYYGGKLYFQNGHYKNAAYDRNCLFPAAGRITLLHSCSYMDFYFCFFYTERGQY